MREEKTQKWLVGERITKPGRGLSPPGSLWPRDAVSPGLKNKSLSLQIWLCRSRSPGSGGSQSGGVGKVWRHSWLSHLGRGKFLASGGKGQDATPHPTMHRTAPLGTLSGSSTSPPPMAGKDKTSRLPPGAVLPARA